MKHSSLTQAHVEGIMGAASNAAAAALQQQKAADPAAAVADEQNLLLQAVKARVMRVEYIGEETPQERVSFLRDKLKTLKELSYGSYVVGDREHLKKEFDSQFSLTLEEFLNNVANVFKDICNIVRPSVEKTAAVGADIDAAMRAKAETLIEEACAAILKENAKQVA